MSSYLECKSDESKQALREKVEAKLQEARLEEEQLRSQLYHPSWAPDALKSATTTQLEHALVSICAFWPSGVAPAFAADCGLLYETEKLLHFTKQREMRQHV